MKILYQPRTVRNWFEGVPAAPEPGRIDPAQLTAWSLGGLLLLALLFVMYIAQTVLLPAVAAAVTAVIFSPVMRWFERRGIGSALAAFIVMGSFVLAIAGGTALLVPTIRTLGSQLPEMAERIDTKLDAVRDSISTLRKAGEKLDKATEVGDAPQTPRVQVEQPGPASSFTVLLFQFGLFAVLTFFFLSARVDYRRRFILSQPSQAERLLVARIMRDMGKRVSSYLFTVTLINVALGILTGIALVAVGMPLAFALLLAFAIALLNFLPFIGPIIVMLATALLSVALFDTWTMMLAPPLIVLVLHLIESQFVSPWLIGRRLEISPIAVFGGIAFLGWIWGAVGAMVAVPILILLYTFGQRIPLLSPLASLIGPTDADLKDEEEETDEQAEPGSKAATVASAAGDAAEQAAAEAGTGAAAAAGAKAGAAAGAAAGVTAGATVESKSSEADKPVVSASATVIVTPS